MLLAPSLPDTFSIFFPLPLLPPRSSGSCAAPSSAVWPATYALSRQPAGSPFHSQAKGRQRPV